VTFKALWGVDAGTSAVLMRASTGAPLLCEKPFGKGRVLLFTSTCNRDWTNFPVRAAFLPWAHRLVSYLAQRPLASQGFHTTGAWVSLPAAATEGTPRLLVKKPDGLIVPATTAADSGDLGFGDTALPGVYQLLGTDNKREGPLFAVNLESAESKLTYLDEELARRDDGRENVSTRETVEEGLKEWLPGRPLLTYVDDPARVAEVALTARRGVKLWDVALAVVLLLALFEPWLANRISARHYARPREPAVAARSPGLAVPQEVASR
jgi:hypothetical protein